MGVRIELLSSRAQRVAREGVGAARLPPTSGLATRSTRAYMATSQCAGATQPHALTTGQLGQGPAGPCPAASSSSASSSAPSARQSPPDVAPDLRRGTEANT